MTVALAMAPNSTVEMSGWTSRGTLDIIGVAGLGQDFNTISEPDSDLNKTYRKLFAPSWTARIFTIVGFVVPNVILRNLPLKRNDDVMEAARIIKRTCLDLIQAKKQMIEKADGQFDVDILSVAIRSGTFTDEGLVNQVMTFMAAGHETTAVAISYAIYLLCLHPEAQTRLREEVRANLPSIEDAITAVNSDVFDSKLPYLQAVTNEALRLHILSPLLLREAACDTVIADIAIPKGTSVVIPLWAFNRSKEVWGPDSEEFKPERWLGAGKVNSGGITSNYGFSTFGHGARKCLGESFAKGEFSCILAAIVGRFEMEMENQKIRMVFGGGILKPEKGLNVKMRVVDGW
jgi:cytochrome P450